MNRRCKDFDKLRDVTEFPTVNNVRSGLSFNFSMLVYRSNLAEIVGVTEIGQQQSPY